MHPRCVNLNIGAFPNVEIVGSALELPLADGCADAILCVSVLEHLTRPWLAAIEMLRVLRPGGTLYTETPWMVQSHGYPSDYYRYTIEGLKVLFAGCRFCDAGPTAGCSSAISVLLRKYIVELTSSRLKQFANYVVGAALLPLKYLAARRDGGLAQGYYLVARKP